MYPDDVMGGSDDAPDPLGPEHPLCMLLTHALVWRPINNARNNVFPLGTTDFYKD